MRPPTAEYFTVREILAEVSTAVQPRAGLWRKPGELAFVALHPKALLTEFPFAITSLSPWLPEARGSIQVFSYSNLAFDRY